MNGQYTTPEPPGTIYMPVNLDVALGAVDKRVA